MLRASIASLLLAPLLAVAAGAGEGAATKHRPNPRLAAMRPHSWLKLGGPPPAPRGIMAYSGGVFDTEHNAIVIFGGGHADYWGNEVCAFDMRTLAWKKMYEPDARARYTNDNIDNTKGKLKDSDKPYTRHSYQMMTFVPSAKKMFIWSGCGPGWGKIAPTCPSPPDAWYYDLAANKWELLTTDGPRGYGGGTCYDPKRDAVWALPGVSWPKLWKFDVKAGKWSKHPMKPESSASCHMNLDYSPRQDKIVASVGNDGKRGYVIDPQAFTIRKADVSTFRPVGYGGQTYLPEQDAMLSLIAGPALGAFEFRTGKWYKLEGPAGGPKMMGYAVYGRFNYTPHDKAALFVGAAGTWAYRPPEKFDFAGLAKKQVKVADKKK